MRAFRLNDCSKPLILFTIRFQIRICNNASYFTRRQPNKCKLLICGVEKEEKLAVFKYFRFIARCLDCQHLSIFKIYTNHFCLNLIFFIFSGHFLAQFFIYERKNSCCDDDDDKCRNRPPNRVVNFSLPNRPDAQRSAGNERNCNDCKGNITNETRFDYAFQFLLWFRCLRLFFVFHFV